MTTKPFAWDGRKLADVPALTAYLRTLPRPAWARAVVIHHTWRPTVAAWRGRSTMDALQRYYRDEVPWRDVTTRALRRGWDAGPHLFIAPDGIWVGTPPTTRGVHAGAWNGWSLGVEVVGDYDLSPWAEATRVTVVASVVALFDWLDLKRASMDTLRGHRECGSPKTCPGTRVDMGQVRSWVQGALAGRHQRYRITSPDGWAAVRIAPSKDAPQALDGTAQIASGEVVLIDGFTGAWGHLSRDNPMRDLGFIHQSLLTKVE